MRRFALLILCLPVFAIARIDYQISLDVPAKTARISVHSEEAGVKPIFRIPAWCPGFYFLQKYEKKISDVRATDGQGTALTVQHSDTHSWSVDNPTGGGVTITYSVLGDDPGLGFFGVNILDHTAFVNGPSAFMYQDGKKDEATGLTIKVPSGWDIATAMDKSADGMYSTGGYDELLDHPIQVGEFKRFPFVVQGIPFEAIWVSANHRYQPDMKGQTDVLAQICAPAIKLFGGAAFKKYLFFLHLSTGGFSGGLEHRASTVINVPNFSDLQLEDLASHEYFHAWNVKQIRPKPLGPFDYTKECRTHNLWLSEGVTDYYAYLNVYRSGRHDADWLLNQFSNFIDELQNSRIRKSKTLEDASWESWENGGFGIGDLSYYTKGAITGLVLDAAIRGSRSGSASLDDFMRLLWVRHRLPKPGFGEDDLRLAANEIAKSDLSAIYNQTVRSKGEVPYEVLRKIGLRALDPGREHPDLGFQLDGDQFKAISEEVQGLGIHEGDRLTRVNGLPYSPGAFSTADSEYDLIVMHEGQSMAIEVKRRMKQVRRWTVERDPFADSMAQKLLAQYFDRPN